MSFIRVQMSLLIIVLSFLSCLTSLNWFLQIIEINDLSEKDVSVRGRYTYKFSLCKLACKYLCNSLL